MAKPVAVLAKAVEQVQLHCASFVVDPQGLEAPPPALQCLTEGHIRVLLSGGLPSRHVATVPRQHCKSTLLARQLLQRNLRKRSGLLLKTIQNAKESLFVKPLRLCHLVVIEVHEAQFPGIAVAQFHQLPQLGSHEGANGAQTLIARLTQGLLRACVHFYLKKLRAALLKNLGVRINVTQLHLIASHGQVTFELGDFGSDSISFPARCSVTLESFLHQRKNFPLRAVHQPSRFCSFQSALKLRQGLGVSQVCLIFLLGARELIYTASRKVHFRRPEVVLKGKVKLLILPRYGVQISVHISR
eukprot:RCo037360